GASAPSPSMRRCRGRGGGKAVVCRGCRGAFLPKPPQVDHLPGALGRARHPSSARLTPSVPRAPRALGASFSLVSRGPAGAAARVRLTCSRAHVGAASRRALIGRADLALRPTVALGHAAPDAAARRPTRRAGVRRACAGAHVDSALRGAGLGGPILALEAVVVPQAA